MNLIDDINNPELTSEERLATARKLQNSFTPDLDAVCEVDMHIHSFCSDGYHSPAGRVFEAWRRGMKGISLTDHDVFDGYPEATSAGEIFGITVVPGIEFYTDRPGIEILGFWPDTGKFLDWLEKDGGRDVIEPLREAKQKQLAAMIARVPECMKKHGFDAEITETDIKKYVKNGVTTKGDISVIMSIKYGKELAQRNIASDVKDFQLRYTTRDDEINVALQLDMDLSPEAFVKRISNWGGLPGISHPTELRKKEGLDNQTLVDVIERLGAVGLRCLEVDGWRNGICPETGMHQTDLFISMLNAYNKKHSERPPLIATNGSDDHNQPGEGLELGCGKNRNLREEFGTYENLISAIKSAGETHILHD